jgi:hypothetical protein
MASWKLTPLWQAGSLPHFGKLEAYPTSRPILFGGSPSPCLALFVNLNMNHVGTAADGAVFHILLRRTARRINRHDDFFAAVVANVGRLVVHAVIVSFSRRGTKLNITAARER